MSTLPAFYAALVLLACSRRGPEIVLAPPLTSCYEQAIPRAAQTLDRLVPIAAQRASLSASRATSHGQPVWLLELDAGAGNQGQWARVYVHRTSESASTVCYLGDKKRAHDAFEVPERTWVRFMSWLLALAVTER